MFFPSALNTDVIPIFFPNNPGISLNFKILTYHFSCLFGCERIYIYLSHLDFNCYAAWQLKFHQRIDSLGSRVVDINESLERRQLKLFPGLLVHECGTVSQ